MRKSTLVKMLFLCLLIATGLVVETTTAVQAMAQSTNSEIYVSGKVIDDSGLPVIGAAVVLKSNSMVGTTTDIDGNYSIKVPSNGVLSYSFLGYKTVDMAVANRQKIDVKLVAAAEDIDAVVVVGYGVQSKKLVSSSIASIKMDDVQKGAEVDPVKSLQGRVTGVSISSPSGIPGAAPNVIVRGVSSISGSSSPLYVVDGIPAESYPNINANDIESMEVLKDASATAIYGSRANSGVIIITTKSGKSGKSSINIDGFYGVAQVSNDIEIANRQEYIRVMQTAVDNYNAQMGENVELFIPDNNTDFDWMKAISRRLALRGSLSASMSGGNDKTTYFAMTGNFAQGDQVEIDLEKQHIYTKGDANDTTDAAPVRFENVIGTPVFSIPWLGYVSSYIQSPPGSYIAVAGGAILLILVFLLFQIY